MIKIELYDFFEIEKCKVERHVGTPEKVLKELKEKCDKLSDYWKNRTIKEFGETIRQHLPLPDWCKNFLRDKGVSLNNDLATIFSFAYGDPNCGWISIHYIKWDDTTLTTKEDLLKMEFGEEELNNLRELGLLLFSKKKI